MDNSIVYVFAFVCAALSGAIASHKNRSAIRWGALGFFLGLIGVLVTMFQSELPARRISAHLGPQVANRAVRS